MFTIPIILAVVAAFLVILLVASYVKSPPDTAFIISGWGKRKTNDAKSALRIPF